ncbi:Microcystinase C (Fragment) [Geodia barretti]|uniref:Microcystinase C n=1 Tax=Geodia barretti TaxID=519541 RepID=A0AA35RN70_GEOBA
MSDRSFRVGVGGMIQESHSFSPASSSLERFRSGLYLRGREVFDTLGSCRHEVAGGLSELREAAVPLFFAFAASSGRPLDDPTYCHLQAELLGAIRDAGPLDGLLLVTHGAMVTEADDDGTGRLYAAIRELVGPDLPIVATIDCHANVTQRMVDLTDAMVFYHTQPHVDHVETGALGARILTGILHGGPRPAKAFRSLPMVLPGENGNTTGGAFEPVMREVGRRGAARRPLRRCVRGAAVDGSGRAAAPGDGTFVFGDSADAPGSGATGDSTALLRALLDAGFRRTALLNIVDAAAVDAAEAAGVGAQVRLTIGASLDRTFYQPVPIVARVAGLAPGRFRHETAANTGFPFDLGGVAVLEVGSISIMAMRRAVVQWDPEMYRCAGLEPTTFRVVQVKSPGGFRNAYGPLADRIFIVDLPGLCSPDFSLFPWKRVRRPIFPLDDIREPEPWRAAG